MKISEIIPEEAKTYEHGGFSFDLSLVPHGEEIRERINNNFPIVYLTVGLIYGQEMPEKGFMSNTGDNIWSSYEDYFYSLE